jgi:hypothetical protein
MKTKRADEGGMETKMEAGRTVPTGTAVGPIDPFAQARDAINRGGPRDAVIKRLGDNGIDPAGL